MTTNLKILVSMNKLTTEIIDIKNKNDVSKIW